jgi:hypothetical protein
MKPLATVLLLGFLVQQNGEAPPGIPPGPAERLFALVKASPGEARWDEIAWTTSLWEARKKAAAEGKPLFLWAANGNPLGMT